MMKESSPTFINDGGPLIILPQEALYAWGGNDAKNADYRWQPIHQPALPLPAEGETDYDLACSVEDTMLCLSSGSSWGLILGDNPSDVEWLLLAEDRGFMAVITLFTSEISPKKILTIYREQEEHNWVTDPAMLTIQQGLVLLMHAASAGREFIPLLAEAQAQGNSLPDITVIHAYPPHWGEMGEDAYIGDGLGLMVEIGTYRLSTCEIHIPNDAHYRFYRFRYLA